PPREIPAMLDARDHVDVVAAMDHDRPDAGADTAGEPHERVTVGIRSAGHGSLDLIGRDRVVTRIHPANRANERHGWPLDTGAATGRRRKHGRGIWPSRLD